MSAKLSSLYSVRRADLDADRDHILRLWSMITSAAAPDNEKLDRFYINNPAGRGVVYLLWHLPSNRAVGISCAGRREVLVDRDLRRGVVCGDLFIEPAHRSLGPTLMLHRHVLDALLREFDLFYAFPNDRAAATISAERNPLKGRLLEMVLPLRVAPYLERKLPTALAAMASLPGQTVLDLLLKLRLAGLDKEHAAVEADDAFLDQLWQAVSAQDLTIGVRNSAFLRWRLQDRGDRRFQVFGVGRRKGTPAAYVAWESREADRVRVVDALAIDERAFHAAIGLFIAAMRRSGIRSISIRQAAEAPERVRFLKRIGFLETGDSTVFVAGRPELRDRLLARPLYVHAIDSDV